jgi:uncharacterized membrane protein YdjX (TVP38/TMEM64 family)
VSEGGDQVPEAGSLPILKIGLAVIGLGVLVFAARHFGGYLPKIAASIEQLGPWGPLAFIAAYVVATVSFVPGSVLTLSGGALFGVVGGTLYVLVAATIGSCLSFLIARYLARGLVDAKLRNHPKFGAIDSAVADQGFKIVLLMRLSPAFPFSFMNYAMGLTRVGFRDYALASFGMFPGTLLYVYYGKVAGDAAALAAGAAVDKDAAYYAVLALGLVATLAVTAIVTRLARTALAQNTPGTEASAMDGTTRPADS